MADADLHRHHQHQQQNQQQKQQQQQQNGIDILCDAAAVGSSSSPTDPDLLLSSLAAILPSSPAPPSPTAAAAAASAATPATTTSSHHAAKRLRRSTREGPTTTTASTRVGHMTGGGGTSNHVCHICKRIYERADHLTRHLRSHENARLYACTRCPKRFNRADLLTRHETSHDRDDGKSRPSIKRSDRANQACEACAVAKAKCDDQKPCGRCRVKQLVCQNPRRGSIYRTYAGGDDSFSETTTAPPAVCHSLPPATVTMDGGAMEDPAVFAPESLGPDSSLMAPMPDEMVYFNPMHNLFQDVDFTMSWDLNLDNFSIPQLDIQGPSPQSSNATTTHTRSSRRVAFRDLSRGHAAFKRSPWLWDPKQEDYVHRDKEGIHFDEGSIAKSPEFGRLLDRPPRKLRLSSQHRDRIFSVVLTQNKDPTKVPAFPTLDLLNYLFQAHFVHDDYQLDSWIHAPSFDPDTTIPEVLAAIISSGATYISIPAIWQFGLAMQEVVREGIISAFERSNATTRDLKAVQGFMLTLDIGIWSGFKRKMEIAESFCQPILTMLRRGGMFSTPPDALSLIPLGSDPPDVVESKWQAFITRESYKRLIIHIFIHDTQTSVSLHKNPLISFTELAFSLPASRDLWRAPTADAWRHIYLFKKPLHQPIPRVCEAMHNLNILDELQDHIDVELCYSTLLHGFWGQIHAYRETIRFYANANVHGNGGAHRLWLRSQHQELYHDLCAFSTIIHTSYPNSRDHNHTVHLSLTLELFLMVLYVSPDEVQKFAGKSGEEEARRVTASLEEHWVNTPEARYAAWHAGQVFLNARRLPPASLRGFNAIAVYLASLTLWAYGLLTYPSGPPRDEGGFDDTAHLHPVQNHLGHTMHGSGTTAHGRATPDGSTNNDTTASSSNKAFVPLDGEESMQTKAFLQFNRGIPALTTNANPSLSTGSSNNASSGSGGTSSGGGDGGGGGGLSEDATVEPLSNTAAVLAIARGIFRENFPVRSEPLPPLVESLGNLLRDLGAGAGGPGGCSRAVSRVVSRMGSVER